MWRVKADAIQPREFAGVATVIHDERPSLPVGALADNLEAEGSSRKSPKALAASATSGSPPVTHQVEAEIDHIDKRFVLVRLRLR